MIPQTPKVNLFQLELENLTRQATAFGAWITDHKWWLIGGAALIIIFILWRYRGNNY